MKIVHIEDFFHPEAGYQINVLPKYMAELGHEVVIITSDMKNVDQGLTAFFGKENINNKDLVYFNKNRVRIIRIAMHGYIFNRAVLSHSLFKIIQTENPDIVYVHGNDTLTGMRMLLKCGNFKYPIIMDSHMLEMASNSKFSKLFHKMYKAIFTPIIVKNNIYVIRTQDDPYVEKCLGIPLDLSPWISVGSDTMLFKPDLSLRKKVRNELKISEDAFLIIYAGKLDKAKGGVFLGKAIKEEFPTDKEIVFLIIGNCVGEYGKEVEGILSESKNRIIRLPSQKYIDLEQYYAASDLAIFPRQCSLSFYDAQASGLPVVSENNNINCDRCSHNNGDNFIAESIEDFRAKMMKFASLHEDKWMEYSKNARLYIERDYDYSNIVNQYMYYLTKSIELKKGREGI